MTATAPEPATVSVTAEGLVIDHIDGSRHTATFTFPIPMAQRTCTDGSHGKAFPDVVVTDGEGAVTHWFIGGRAKLPAIVNTAVAEHFKRVVGDEHAAAESLGLLPVRESVVARFRETDPNATIEEIRYAESAYQGMVEDLGMGSRRTALWIARNYISAARHLTILQALEVRILDLEDEEPAKCDCPEQKPEKARDEHTASMLNVVQLLRTHGRRALEYRAGNDDVEKLIDLFDAA